MQASKATNLHSEAGESSADDDTRAATPGLGYLYIEGGVD